MLGALGGLSGSLWTSGVTVPAAILFAGAVAIVAAAYADHAAIGSPDPDVIATAAARQGAEGVLLDTWAKDGRTLLDWIEPSALRRWVARSSALGLLTAVAGSLDLATLPRVLESGADIVGVRGAACEGGRSGELRRERVARLREAVAAARVAPV
jgi:uncharacterized protein (UPF0264 family)